jgi:hypothetical protein
MHNLCNFSFHIVIIMFSSNVLHLKKLKQLHNTIRKHVVRPLCKPDAPPSSLMDSTASPKVKIMEGERVGARSLARSILG